MGQIDMLGGVFIRTGSVIAALGVRVVSGLVQRLGSLSFISDNTGCLGGRPFPRDGRIMSFSSHEVYVGTERVCREDVLVAADPPSHRLAHAGRSARSVESAEVMMAGTSVPSAEDAGKAAASDTPPEPLKAKRSARPPLEHVENLAGTSGVPARGQVLLPIIDRLLDPVRSGDDPEQTREVLEGSRQALVDEALAMH
jgi:hypothetical protein